MIIKNYYNPPMLTPQPALDLQIIEDVTDIIVYAACFNADEIGDLQAANVTTVYGGPEIGTGKCTSTVQVPKIARRIDFTRHGVRSRLIVMDHAFICSDEGKTIERVKI